MNIIHTKIHNLGSLYDSANTPLLKMWQVEISPGKRSLIRHQHINFEIMLVNQGSGTYTTERASYPITPGAMFIFSSNEFHCITDVGEDGLTITNLQFDPRYIQNDFGNGLSTLNFCFSHHPAFENRISEDAARPLSLLFQTLQAELKQQLPEYTLSIRSNLNLLLIELLRNFHYAAESPEFKSEQLRSIEQAITYMNQHFCEKITLQELSALAGLTPNYFCTLFKQVSGMTLWTYISAKRIDKAILLLTQKGKSLSILDIAAECGFNNSANFNKTFKKITGMSPSEYRRNGQPMIS